MLVVQKLLLHASQCLGEVLQGALHQRTTSKTSKRLYKQSYIGVEVAWVLYCMTEEVTH